MLSVRRGGDAKHRLVAERDDSEEDCTVLMRSAAASHPKTKMTKSSPKTTGCPSHSSSLDYRERRVTFITK